MALETRTNPIGDTTYVPQTFAQTEVLEQIKQDKRPDLEQALGFFWALGTAGDGSSPRH